MVEHGWSGQRLAGGRRCGKWPCSWAVPRAKMQRKPVIYEALIPAAVALLIVVLLTRVGRWLPAQIQWLGYLLTAYVASVLGLLTAWAYGRWLSLPEAERNWAGWATAAQQASGLLWQPQFQEHWIPLALTVSAGLCLVGGVIWRWLSSPWLAMPAGVFVSGLLAGLVYRLLDGSIYFMPLYSRSYQIWAVILPALALVPMWASQWLRLQWVSGRERGNNRADTDADTSRVTSKAACDVAGSDHWLYLLAVLAVTLGGVLLLATSGTLSKGTQSLVFAMVPLGWLIECWLPARGHSLPRPVLAAGSLVGWLPVSTGVMVVIGYFFAEVSWLSASVFALSLWMLPAAWPSAQQHWSRTLGWAILAAAPALLASGWSAWQMVGGR